MTGWIGAPWPRQRWVAWPSRRILRFAFESYRFYINASLDDSAMWDFPEVLSPTSDVPISTLVLTKISNIKALLIELLWDVSLESIGMCNKRQEKPPAPATRTCGSNVTPLTWGSVGPFLDPFWSRGARGILSCHAEAMLKHWTWQELQRESHRRAWNPTDGCGYGDDTQMEGPDGNAMTSDGDHATC